MADIQLQHLPTYQVAFQLASFLRTLDPIQKIFQDAIYLFHKDISSNDSAYIFIWIGGMGSQSYGSDDGARGGNLDFNIELEYSIPQRADHSGIAAARGFITDYLMLAIKRNEVQFAVPECLFPLNFDINNSDEGTGTMSIGGRIRYVEWFFYTQSQGIDLWKGITAETIDEIAMTIHDFNAINIKLDQGDS